MQKLEVGGSKNGQLRGNSVVAIAATMQVE